MHFDEARGQWVATINRTVNGVRYRKARRLPKGTSAADAKNIEDRMQLDILHSLKTSNDETWKEYVNVLASKKSWLDAAYAKCIYRSKLRGQQCSITRQHIVQAMLLTNGRCQLSGLKFCMDAAPGRSNRPFMHSIDRINSSEGYTVFNIRIVCAGINIAMMHWGEELFSQLAVGYVLHKYAFISDVAENSKIPNNRTNGFNLEKKKPSKTLSKLQL